MAQDELDSFLRAQIGQPVLAEDAFDGDDQVLAVGLDRFQQSLGTGAEVTVQQNLTPPSRSSWKLRLKLPNPSPLDPAVAGGAA